MSPSSGFLFSINKINVMSKNNCDITALLPDKSITLKSVLFLLPHSATSFDQQTLSPLHYRLPEWTDHLSALVSASTPLPGGSFPRPPLDASRLRWRPVPSPATGGRRANRSSPGLLLAGDGAGDGDGAGNGAGASLQRRLHLPTMARRTGVTKQAERRHSGAAVGKTKTPLYLGRRTDPHGRSEGLRGIRRVCSCFPMWMA